MNSWRVVPLTAAALATAAIGVATLVPDHSPANTAQPEPFEGQPFPLADLLRNLTLFAPLGVGLAWSRVPTRRALTLAAALSGGIELAQGAIPIAGRDASAIDWLANVGGAGIAVVLFRTAPAWLHPPAPRAARFALLAAASILGVSIATGVLLAPDPTAAVYYGHHTPSLGHLAPYTGSVIDASIDGIEIPHGPLADSDRVRARLAGDYSLRVSARSGEPPADLAGLLLITDRAENEILLLGPDGDDLVYRFRSRGEPLGFETASVRLPHALASIRPGREIALQVDRSRGDLCIAIDAVARCGQGFTVGDGWLLIAPDYRLLASWRPVVEACWLAALFVPLGYWGRPTRATAAAWAGPAVALVLLPTIAPLRPTPFSQLAGAAFGAALGVAAQRHFATLAGHSERGV